MWEIFQKYIIIIPSNATTQNNIATVLQHANNQSEHLGSHTFATIQNAQKNQEMSKM